MASKFSTLFPLIVLIILVGGCSWVLYQTYVSFTKARHSASEKMGRNNVVFTRDGVRINVKPTTNESYVDATQSYVVKAWNLGSAREKEDSKKR